MSALSSPSSPITPVFRSSNKEAARWDAERDTDMLFQNHSIEEIRETEQKTRNDIQLKREELRQMVGERYRDLIGAADSISDMLSCCKQASSSLSNSHQLCGSLQQTYKLKGTGPLQHGSSQGHELMCAGVNHMKLLVGIQGKIWSSIDVMDYKQAAVLYLTAKHIVSKLCLESVVVTHKKSVLSGIAIVLLQQWASIRHFQSTILDCCRQSLKSTSMECSTILQSLVTMATLDHISTRQALNEFLIGRKAAIQQVFHPSQQVISVKSQMCQLVTIIKSCLLLTASLFCRTSLQERSRIVSSLNDNLVSLQEAGLDVPATPTEIDQSALHNSYREWLSMCTADIKAGVSKLLHHVTSVKALSGIRDAVHDVLSQESDNEIDWEDACNVVLGRKLCVWKELLQPLLFARAQVVLEGKFSDIERSFADIVSNFIDQTTTENSTSSSSFLWREEDENPGSGNSSILRLKATGCSPHTNRFCLEFGKMLGGVADEVSHYTAPEEKTVNKVQNVFDKYDDSSEMYQFVQQRTTQLTNKFLNVVNEVKPEMASLDCSSVERLLLLGQLCQGLQQHCPLLITLSQGCRPVKPKSRIVSTSRTAVVGDLDKMNRQPNGVMELLHQMFTSIYRDWCEWTATQLTERYSNCLFGDDPLSCTVLNWEEVKISEETEGGNTVESIIRVPAQASCYVTNLLFVLCQQLATIRGHSLDKELLLHIGYNILRNVIDIYNRILLILESASSQQLQNCALQLLFDVKFLSNLLPHSSTLATQEGGDLTKPVQHIVTQLENFIDPFDLDVFRPHLTRNLDRHHQRCSVMLGSISSLRSSHIKLKGSSGVTGVTQEKHNVMPVAPSVAAFTSLPVITPSLSQETPSLQSVQAPLSINEQMNFFVFLNTDKFIHVT